MLILIASGFGLGMFAHKYTAIREASPSPPKPNLSVYQASPPSQGRINFTIPVDLAVVERHADIALPLEQAKDVKVDQHVLLYDKDNNLLPIIGKIISVEPATEQSGNDIKIRIRIDDGPEAPANTVTQGEIVYDTEKYAPRLPVSAIVHHNDDSAHIWSVVSDGDGRYYARLKTFTRPLQTFGDFFVMQEGEYSSDVYILNPDDKLQEDQPVKITKILYEPANVPNPQTIEGRRVGWVLTPKQPPVANSSGCGTPTSCGGGNGITDFINKIKTMAAEEAKKPVTAP